MSDFPRRRWLCVREDFRNGVIPYFGQYLFFFQARIALKLHQRKHPDTERYLSSLNMLELRSDHRREFRSRAIRSILLPGDERSQLFLRVQHWRLVEAKELRTTKPTDFQYSNVDICCNFRIYVAHIKVVNVVHGGVKAEEVELPYMT